MKLLLVGYGAMNKRVAALAEEKGHEITAVVTPDDAESVPYTVFSSFNEKLPEVDAVIDFSHPDLTKQLLDSSITAPLVIATTGEKETLVSKLEEKAKTQAVFFSANMSYGVHILTELVKYATPLLEDFDIELLEKHHNQKVDAPSGTLVKLLDAIKESARPEAEAVYNRHDRSEKRDDNEIGVSAIRGGTIVGEHDVIYAGVDEEITLTHRAQSKNIFANGALTVAKQIVEKPNGFYTFSNLND